MITTIIFDLDDTLYDEWDFVRGGFAAVARELQSRGISSADRIESLLGHFHLAESRAGVFQKLAQELDFPVEWIPELVARFRRHDPQIALAPDAVAVLSELRSRYRLGCLTDGWANVQRRKVAALGVEAYLHSLVLTDELGIEFWKPHARGFDEVRATLGGEANATLVVGDSPERDMAGARNAGLPSVRLRRPGGYFAHREFAQDELRADFEISDLRMLPNILRSL